MTGYLVAAIACPGVALLVHRAGVAYTLRVVGNWCYAAAFAVEHFCVEFRRLNSEARKIEASK